MTTKNIYQSIYQQQIYLNSGLADIYLNGSKKSNVVFFFQELLKHDKGCIEMRISLVNAQFQFTMPTAFGTTANSLNFLTDDMIFSAPVGA